MTVNATQTVRTVNGQLHGINVNWWDTALNSATTRQLVQSAGLTTFRFPGGSSSDEFHFNDPPSYNGKGTAASFASFIASVGGGGMVTLDYGSGSPQEAAAFLAYLNAPVGATAAIGMGQEWNTTSSTWVQKDWKTAGYWAALRAATPLGTDDGLNFLRLGRSTPFAFHYYEVGNEVYGSWETDHHGSGGDGGAPHDPATYVAFAKQFKSYASLIDPTISIGLDGQGADTWMSNVLQQCAAQGFTPGFVSDHTYMQAPGSENDSTLLLHTVTDSSNFYYWPSRASNYRTLLQQKLGSSAAGVELLATEHNSVYSNPGKQSTSLVNGLFLADSMGEILQTEFNGMWVWGLRNSFDTANNNSASLYGWRQGGDYGLLGSGSNPPATGTYVPYPNYFAEQLVSKFANTGDTVIHASSNDTNLSAYAVKQANGHLDLLVINKNSTTDLTAQFQLTGFQPSGALNMWQYGKTEDTAQSQTSDGHAALTNLSSVLALTGANFSYTFPSYSMTVLDLAPAASVVARQTFYNNSKYDGNDATANVTTDAAAIATDKVALLPGQTAGNTNFTNYTRGINGIIIDIANLPVATLSASDFAFKVGTTADPTTWAAAPAPSSITVFPGGGLNGAARVELIWPDTSIVNRWLQVTVNANPATTGLTSPDLFYFGNLIGDTGDAAPGATAAVVNATDVLNVKANNLLPATLTSPYDSDRNGVINATDVLNTKSNNLRTLLFFTAPPPPPSAAASSGPSPAVLSVQAVQPLIPLHSGRRRSWLSTQP